MRREVLSDVELIGVERLCGRMARGLHPASIGGAVVPPHPRRRMAEASDFLAGFVPHPNSSGSERSLPALLPHPFLFFLLLLPLPLLLPLLSFFFLFFHSFFLFF